MTIHTIVLTVAPYSNSVFLLGQFSLPYLRFSTTWYLCLMLKVLLVILSQPWALSVSDSTARNLLASSFPYAIYYSSLCTHSCALKSFVVNYIIVSALPVQHLVSFVPINLRMENFHSPDNLLNRLCYTLLKCTLISVHSCLGYNLISSFEHIEYDFLVPRSNNGYY